LPPGGAEVEALLAKGWDDDGGGPVARNAQAAQGIEDCDETGCPRQR
jgi:hypothetical protein